MGAVPIPMLDLPHHNAGQLRLTNIPGNSRSITLGAFGYALFVAILVLTWVSLMAAEIGKFHAWIPFLFAALAFAWAWRIGLGRVSRGPDVPSWNGKVILGIALGSLVLTLPPSETVLGGWDPGVYLHTAASVAREGGLRFQHPDLAALDGLAKSLLARDLFSISEPFGGMRVLADGSISPQFYHAYPSLLAVFWALGGVWSALLVNPLLNVGCIFFMAALASRLVGRRWAVVAALLLALNPAQIWQAKFSTAEILGQFFLLGGSVLWLDVHREKKVTSKALLAGAAFGLALLTRYDALLVLAPLFTLSLLLLPVTANKKGILLSFLVLGVLVGQVWLHQKYVAPYYRPMIGLVVPALQVVFLVLVIWLPLAFSPIGRVVVAYLRPWTSVIRGGAATCVAAWACFAWWVRPALGTSRMDARVVEKLLERFGGDGLLSLLTGREAGNMLYLADVFGPIALLLGVAGICLFIWRARDTGAATWLYASVAVLLLLTLNVYHDHFLLWVARRFVPVVVPLLVIGIVVALQQVTGWVPVGRAGVLPGVALAVVLVVLNARPILLTARHRDWPGLVAWFEDMNEHVPPGAVLVCDQSGFAAPLRFMYEKHAFELHFADRGTRRQDVTTVLRSFLDEGMDVLYLSAKPSPVGGPVVFDPVYEASLATYIVRTSRRMPTGTKSRGGDFLLYRVAPSTPVAP